MRNKSTIAPGWWDYTTLDEQILKDAAALSIKDIEQLGRDGFEVVMYDNIQEFYAAEALEYVKVFQKSTEDHPLGVCGPIGPTEQLPIVAQIINDLDIDIRSAHFWGMDEWVSNGKTLPATDPISFKKCDMDFCFNRIRKELRMDSSHMHFPTLEHLAEYTETYNKFHCELMQGGQGSTKHWAFNDPVKREGKYVDNPPTPEEYMQKSARLVDLHPLTIIQNARTSNGGVITDIPTQAVSVGPKETFTTDCVSIWHPGSHDNSFGMRLSSFMISKNIADSSVPMSILGKHQHVRYNFFRPAIKEVKVDMH